MPYAAIFRLLAVSLILCLFLRPSLAYGQAQQATADQQAVQLLETGKRSYNERNLQFAIDRFRQFLQQYGGHRDAHQARLGLGMSLLELPKPEIQQAIEQLRPAADADDFPQRALANYYLATAYRALGHAALSQSLLKPTESPQHRANANQQFELAFKAFENASAQFSKDMANAKPAVPNEAAALQPADALADGNEGQASAAYEWFTRTRLDAVEMQLHLGKVKEALTSLEKIVAEPEFKRSKYGPLTIYYTGYSQYALGDWKEAARSLIRLAPFSDAIFGVHARYMLARSNHLAGQRPEAMKNYQTIITAYDEELTTAKQVAGNSEMLKNDPAERARMLLVAQNPPPDYVARSWFYAGVLAYEEEKFADALDRFSKFVERFKTHVLAPEAVLRKGMSQVRSRSFAEALPTLTPIQDDANLGDQARWWLGKAYVGLAAANVQNAPQNHGQAISQLRTSADRAGQRANQDPEAKLRRQDTLLELGDVYLANKQANESVTVFQQVMNEQPVPQRGEIAAQRLATALHLAGKYAESDAACDRFTQNYPKSTLLSAVLFRKAENAFAVAEAAFKRADLPNREAALKQAYDEVIARTTKLVEAYPESPEVSFAWHALGIAQYRTGDIEKAATTLTQIPAADRTGELATMPLVLADCLLRLTPETAEDAIAAGQLLEQSGEAAKLLEAFIASNPQSPSLPDALIKLGDAQLRIGSVTENEQERNQTLQLARQAYEKVMQQFGQHPLNAVAVYERARCMIAQRDVGGAMNEYRRFLGDPLRSAPIAPMAVLRLATMLRIEKRPQEAVDPLNQTRQQHEAALMADPARTAWAPMLQYYQALCLKEARKLPESQAMFENLVQRFPKSADAANAVWRAQQCRREQVLAKLEPATITLARVDASAADTQAAKTVVQDAVQQYTQMAAALQQHATALHAVNPASEAELSTLEEAAWCYRLLAQQELLQAREKLREAGRNKRQEELNRLVQGRTPNKAALADVAWSEVPLQPAETKAREMYQTIIDSSAETRLVPVAKLELAEVLTLRGEFEKAAALLQDALGGDVSEELADRMKVRLAACLIAQNDGDSALSEVEALAKNEKNPVAPEARFLAGEALIAQKKFAPAVELLKLFRDHGPLQNLPALSDRALMRLGYAYEQLGQWDQARQSYETLWSRFPNSPWRAEARYSCGWCHEKQSQWDAAVNAYNEVVRTTAADAASRAQYRIGVCRAAQQRWQEAADAFQLCAFTYDAPELCGQALVDAAAALESLKKTPEAGKLLAITIKDFATTKAAPIAAERLGKLPATP